MSFAADLKGFVSGFEKGWKMGGDAEASADRRQARQDALNAKDPNYMTPAERAEFERTRGRGALPTTDASGGTTGSTGGKVDTKANGDVLMKTFTDLGYTPEAAAGIVGNLHAESGLNPRVKPGDKGTAFGIAQWRGDRWTNMQKFAQDAGADPYDLQTQARFVDHELRGMPRVRSEMMNAKDPSLSAGLFAKFYERPLGSNQPGFGSIHNIGGRQSLANAYFKTFNPGAAATQVAKTDTNLRTAYDAPASGAPATATAATSPPPPPAAKPTPGIPSPTPAPTGVQTAMLEPIPPVEVPDVGQTPTSDEEEAIMARQPTTFARRGGAIPAPAQRFRGGGRVQRFVTGGTPQTAATYGAASGVNRWDWEDEQRRRRAAGVEEEAAPATFAEDPIYRSQIHGDKYIGEGAIGPDGTPYGSGLAAVYSSGYTPGKITMADGTQVDPSTIAAQREKDQEAWQYAQNSIRMQKLAGTAQDPRLFAGARNVNAPGSWAMRWSDENALPGGNAYNNPQAVAQWQGGQQGGNQWSGGGGGAPQSGGGQWAAMGLNPQQMAGGRGGATGASSIRSGATGAAGRGVSAKDITDVNKSPWHPGQSIEGAIATPWAKQRQWEQYGSPAASTGGNLAGTYPAAAYAGSYFGGDLYGEEGGTIPDAEEREAMGHFYEGGAIPDGTLAYYHGGTVRYFNGGPVQQFEGGGAATSAMDEARERIMMRNGAYRQGLTQGDLARAKSDPSRYGPYYGDRPAAPAAAKPAPGKGKPGGGTKKEPPKKKDVTTTGGTGGRDDRFEHYKVDDPSYPRNVDPDRMERDDGPIGPPAPATPTPANPNLQPTPDNPVTAMGDRAFGDTSTLPFDPQRNPFDVQRGETPMSRQQAIPGPQNLQPRRGVSTPAGEYPQANPMAGAEAGSAAGPPPATVGIMSTMAPMRARIENPPPPAPAAPLAAPRTPRPPIGTPMVDPATGLPIDPRTGQPVAPRGPGMYRGGTVPRYQDGGAMLTEQDLMRQQSDPTRYGAEPGMPPPTAAPPGRGIPSPGGAQAAGAPAAPVAQQPAASQRPRPESDSGYYQKPSREEIAQLNKIGLDEIQRMIAGQSADQQTTGSVGPAIGPDPRQQVAANAYGSNALAPSTQEMQAAYKTSDPEGKLSTDELQLKTLQDMHDFWLAQGNDQKARTAAAHVLLYGKKVASTSGAMALSAAEDGNLLQAAQWLSKGYAHIANGESVRFEQDPKDPSKITYWRVGPDGERTQEPTVIGQREVQDMAIAMANGSGWLQETVTAARGGRQGRTAAKGPGYEERTREENKAALAGLSAAGEELEAARAGNDQAAIKAAETKFKTEYRKTLTTPSLGSSAKPIAEQYMPDVIPKTPEKPSDKEQETERQRVADEKEVADAQQKVDAEQDPVKKKALQRDLEFIPINRQYDKAVAGQKRAVPSAQINTAIPADLKGNERNTVRAAVEGILRGNNMTAVSAYDLVAAASDPQLATQVNFQGGRMNVPGFGGVLINSEIGKLIADLHKARKTKGLVLNPAAVKNAPAEEEPVEED